MHLGIGKYPNKDPELGCALRNGGHVHVYKLKKKKDRVIHESNTIQYYVLILHVLYEEFLSKRD